VSCRQEGSGKNLERNKLTLLRNEFHSKNVKDICSVVTVHRLCTADGVAQYFLFYISNIFRPSWPSINESHLNQLEVPHIYIHDHASIKPLEKGRVIMAVKNFIALNVKVKGKVIPLQARCGPEGG